MKDLLKQNILQRMSNVLNFQQMQLLEKVIHQNFQEVEIERDGFHRVDVQKDNEELLHYFISSKKVEGCSEKSLKYYLSTIQALLSKMNKQIVEISTNDLRFYLSEYQERNNSSQVTIDNIRRIFSSFFSWLEDEDYILKSPVRRINRIRTAKTVKEILTDEDIEVLRDNCKQVRDLSLVELLYSTGMRVGELVRIDREHINFHERSCIVTGKGNKEREVYFDARTKLHLLEYLKTRKDGDSALFVSLHQPNQRLSIAGVENIVRKLGKKCNIKKVHPHKFRRTLATVAIDKGMPIEQVQKLLGHVKIDTTLNYAQVQQTNVKISHRKYIS